MPFIMFGLLARLVGMAVNIRMTRHIQTENPFTKIRDYRIAQRRYPYRAGIPHNEH